MQDNLNNELKNLNNELPKNLTKQKVVKKTDEDHAAKIEAMRLKDREKVRGLFRYIECPGGVLEFVFHKYKKDPVETYTLMDGQVYELPRGVATHLNTNVSYPEYEYLSDKDQNIVGSGIVSAGSAPQNYMGMAGNLKIKNKVRRCAFQSLDYTEFESWDMDNKIIQVER